MEQTDNHEFIFSMLGIANIIFSGLVVITYMTSKNLQQHPSGIIVSLALCELAVSYHNIIYIWGTNEVIEFLTIERMRIWKLFGLEESSAENCLCFINQWIFIFGAVASLLYNIVLCVDLMLSLRRPFSPAYKRMIFYHLIVLTLTFVLSIPLTVLNADEACGLTILKDQHNKKAKALTAGPLAILIAVYCIIGLFSIIYAIVRVYRGIKLSNASMIRYLVRHILYVSVYIFSWGSTIVSYACSRYYHGSTVVDTIAEIAISVAGVSLSLIRLSNPAVYKKIISGNAFSYESGTKNTDEWKIPLDNIMGDVNVELSGNIFDALYSVFSKKDDFIEYEITDAMCKEEKNHKGKRYSRLAECIGQQNGYVDSRLIEYSPMVFDSIRKNNNISSSMIRDSTDPKKNIDSFIEVNESKGKSGSFFMFTHDKHLVMKTIKEKEVNVLRRIIKSYAEHLKKNPKSLLCKIYGLFYLKLPGISPVYIMIMENLLLGCHPELLFDLKGSTLGRSTKKSTNRGGDNTDEESGPLKDLDFIRYKLKISLLPSVYLENKSEIIKDTEFLASHRLMDYSLLLSVEKINGEFKFTFGIIDFLIEYGLFKKIERAFSVIKNPLKSSEASVINPNRYAERFKSFILGGVFHPKKNS